jgi:hypothetical protein
MHRRLPIHSATMGRHYATYIAMPSISTCMNSCGRCSVLSASAGACSTAAAATAADDISDARRLGPHPAASPLPAPASGVTPADGLVAVPF